MRALFLAFVLLASAAACRAQPAAIDSFLTRYPLIEGFRSDTTGYELRGAGGDTLQVLYNLQAEPGGWVWLRPDSVCAQTYLDGVACASRAAFDEWSRLRLEMEAIDDLASAWRILRARHALP